MTSPPSRAARSRPSRRAPAHSIRNAPADQYPVSYTITWKYQGRADCYEPNDTRELAKRVPVNTDLEAWALTNRTANGHASSEHFDWYRIELESAATVRFELLSVPSDTTFGLHAFSPSRAASIGASVGKQRGEAHTMDLGQLEPGTYFIHVETASFDAPTSGHQEPPPRSLPDAVQVPRPRGVIRDASTSRDPKPAPGIGRSFTRDHGFPAAFVSRIPRAVSEEPSGLLTSHEALQMPFAQVTEESEPLHERR